MVGALQKFTDNGVLTIDANSLDDLDVFDTVMQLVNPRYILGYDTGSKQTKCP